MDPGGQLESFAMLCGGAFGAVQCAKTSMEDGGGSSLIKAGAWMCALSGRFYNVKPGGTAGAVALVPAIFAEAGAFLFVRT